MDEAIGGRNDVHQRSISEFPPSKGPHISSGYRKVPHLEASVFHSYAMTPKT